MHSAPAKIYMTESERWNIIIFISPTLDTNITTLAVPLISTIIAINLYFLWPVSSLRKFVILVLSMIMRPTHPEPPLRQLIQFRRKYQQFKTDHFTIGKWNRKGLRASPSVFQALFWNFPLWLISFWPAPTCTSCQIHKQRESYALQNWEKPVQILRMRNFVCRKYWQQQLKIIFDGLDWIIYSDCEVTAVTDEYIHEFFKKIKSIDYENWSGHD